MPAVCVCDCGLTVEDGKLCLDWQAVGMYRACVTAEPYSNSFVRIFGDPEEWFQLRAGSLFWRNDTCRTHRVVVRAEIPYVRILVGPGNRWEVRTFIDAGIDTVDAPFDGARTPEMFWTSNWATGLPQGTAQYQEAPGAASREFVVPPGSHIIAQAVVQAHMPAFESNPVNLLAFGALQVSLSACPSHVDSGIGRTC